MRSNALADNSARGISGVSPAASGRCLISAYKLRSRTWIRLFERLTGEWELHRSGVVSKRIGEASFEIKTLLVLVSVASFRSRVRGVWRRLAGTRSPVAFEAGKIAIFRPEGYVAYDAHISPFWRSHGRWNRAKHCEAKRFNQ